MISTVAAEYHWPPDVLGGLFFDSQDIHGLKFWYDILENQDKKFKEKTKQKGSK